MAAVLSVEDSGVRGATGVELIFAVLQLDTEKLTISFKSAPEPLSEAPLALCDSTSRSKLLCNDHDKLRLESETGTLDTIVLTRSGMSVAALM